MSVITLILLFIVGYLCVKSVRSIWRDTFGSNSRQGNNQRHQSRRGSHKKQKPQTPPIQKGEGDYVDYEEV